MNKRSNSGQNNRFEVPASIKNTGKFLQFFSANAAAKFTFKLFTTPPKFEAPERELMLRQSAKNIPMEIPGVEEEVMLYEYGFSKRKVLLAHGWAGRGTQLYEIADKLLEHGFMVISFDAPAHGQSGGKRTYLLDNVKTVRHISDTYGPFEAAIGHSFGGITLLRASAKDRLFDKIVTIGIEGSMHTILDDFVKKIGLKPKITSAIEKHILNEYHAEVDRISGNESAKKVSSPVLVVHDINDTDVDVSSAFRLRQNLRNGTLMITEGLGHRKILRDQNVIDKIIRFIK